LFTVLKSCKQIGNTDWAANIFKMGFIPELVIRIGNLGMVIGTNNDCG
jgi:hypothetical protein